MHLVTAAWCRCRLSLRGPAAEVARFRRAAAEAEPPGPLSFARLVPVPDRLQSGAAPRRQTWCMRHWGSRGPARDVVLARSSPRRLDYLLATEWQPPVAFVAQVSGLFPLLCFELHYDPPGDALGEVIQRFARGRCVEGPRRELNAGRWPASQILA